MKLSELPIVEVTRVISSKEADKMVGVKVPEIEANATQAGIYIDAETKEPFLAYFPMPDTVAELRKAVLNINYGDVIRQSTGLRNESVTFGMAPRKPFQRRESCRPTALSYNQPAEHAVLVLLADSFSKMFQEFAPDLWAKDRENVENVADEWRMTDDAMWTSGVVNKSSELPYHRDGFNFATWSAMPVVRRNMKGGYLSFPEYDLTVSCRDGWVLFFPGYKYLHGVTPMETTAEDGYRYSVVYYALKGMKDCFTFAVEASEAAKRRTGREEDFVKVLKGEGEFKLKKKFNKKAEE